MTKKNILTIIVAFAIGAAIALFAAQLTNTAKNPSVSTGKPLIGGPFKLTDHTGKRVTEKDFQGKLSLVYFGYSFCPDVCPTELQVIGNAMDLLGDQGKKLTPIFITIDPQRDTPEALSTYVTHFHPKMVGLTGTAEEIKKVAKAYKVYYGRAKTPKGEEEDPDNYLMDHSNIIYVMGKDGKYLDHLTHTTDPKKIIKKISKYL